MNTTSIMSGYEISPFDGEANNWRDCLTNNVYDMYLLADNTEGINKIIENLVHSLVKLVDRGINPDMKVLAHSSTMEKICSAAAKEHCKCGGEKPSSVERVQFKEFYARYLIEAKLADELNYRNRNNK